MKRLLVVFMAVLLVVGFVSAVLAEDPSAGWDLSKFDRAFAVAKVMTVEGDRC